MTKTIITFGSAAGIAALALQWFENGHALQIVTTDVYVLVLALTFTSFGIWIGRRVADPPKSPRFTTNRAAIVSHRLTTRELEVLELLAQGDSNRDIATRLFVSTSTVKTHVLHLYQKLDVSRRTQAVHKAKDLQIIP